MSGSNQAALRQVSLDSGYAPRRVLSNSPPVIHRANNFFATAILEESASDRTKRAAQTGLALTIQIAIVGALLLIPLLFTEGIDLYRYNSTLLIAPPSPAAPPPPAVHAQAVAPKPSILHAQLTAPVAVPKNIVTSETETTAAAPMIAGMAGGVPGGMGDVLGGSLAGAPPPPPAPAAKPKGPIRIYSGMKEPALLYAPPVVYSPIARQAHVSGTVIIEAVIDEKGNVTQVHVVSGPALLVESALKAVSARKYQPTILDGSPVPIRFNVKVQFTLS